MCKSPVCPVALHEAIKHDAAAWSALPLIGTQPTFDDDDRPMVLELRNCTAPGCNSTLARRVGI